MTVKYAWVYRPYAIALATHDYDGLMTDDMMMLGEWLGEHEIQRVELVKDEKGNYVASDGYCSICGEFVERLGVKVTLEPWAKE
jgi:hypothetical protein